MTPNVEDFARLFAGRTDAYGTGKGYVVRGTVTMQHYADHLLGRDPGLGIFPVLDSNEVWWACIDIDEPDFELAAQVEALLPSMGFTERSRSGNAHVWFFFETPIDAWVPRALCRSALEAVGHPNVEVFPKQDRLREGGLGNFVNLPLHGDDRPILDCDERDFTAVALSQRANPADWRKRAQALGLKPAAEAQGSEFRKQVNCHPCALHIYENRFDNPIQPGARAVVIFAVAKQLLNWRALAEDEARTMIHEINDASPEPLPKQEVNRIIGTVVKGQYTSTSCDDPLMAPYILPDCVIAHG